jgi:hypothetical protein
MPGTRRLANIDPAIRAKVLRALADGKGVNATARALGVAAGTVRNIRDRAGGDRPRATTAPP